MITENHVMIAIVGRPNVGKSTLFNKLVGRRQAIVYNEPGVTRDRHVSVGTYRDRKFTLVDTGGYCPGQVDQITGQIRRQSEIAIRQAEAILFVMDAREGVNPLDYDILKHLRESAKAIYGVVNKIDGVDANQLYEFYRLGVPRLFCVSSEHNTGLSELLDALYPTMSPTVSEAAQTPATEEAVVRVVVLGRPNAGKSTLINTLLKEERVIVSDVAGTTRDAIDLEVAYKQRPYVFVDTAGIRKRGRVKHGVEQYSVLRAQSALARSDVALLMIDGEDGITEQDTKIAGMILEAGRGAVLLINKSDRLTPLQRAEIERRIQVQFTFMRYVPAVFLSALKGVGINRMFQQISAVFTGLNKRVSTGALNRFFSGVVKRRSPPIYKGRPLRLYYITQSGVSPPTFSLFASAPSGLPDAYTRYIENQLRDAFGFVGTPVRIQTKAHH